jgi:uncharacterized protein YndB with AHSA1/START domain
MNQKNDAPDWPDTRLERASDCELLVTRRFDAPARLVYEAWARPERLAQPMIFFGKYLEVLPSARLAWTNDESEDGPITRAAVEEQAGQTLVALRDC